MNFFLVNCGDYNKNLALLETTEFQKEIDKLPISIGNSEELQRLRKLGVTERQLFRDATFLYYTTNRPLRDLYDTKRLDSSVYEQMYKNGSLLHEEAANKEAGKNVISRMRGLLQSGACVNIIGENRTTALESALVKDDFQKCKLLAQETNAKARVEYLILRDNVKILKLLLDKSYINKYDVALQSAKSAKNNILHFLLTTQKFTPAQWNELLVEYSKTKNLDCKNLTILLQIAEINKIQEPILPNCVHDLQGLKMIFKHTKIGLYEAVKNAVSNNCVESLEFLLKNGGDSNLVFNSATNETLLMRAAENGNRAIVRTLIKYGARTDIQNSDGNTAAVIAMHKGHKRIANIILGNDTCVDNLWRCFGNFTSYCCCVGERCCACLTLGNVYCPEFIDGDNDCLC